MTISYVLAPMPIWIAINNSGITASGAQLFGWRTLNKTQPKTFYVDPAGQIPWPNPVTFDAPGTKGPFYFASDSANPADTYFLQLLDNQGNTLWSVDNFPTGAGSGGGGGSTSVFPLKNMIANNIFLDNTGNTASPIASQNVVLCPSNHHRFTPDLINPVIGTYGAVGPDIRFVKNNTNATDQITFVPFTAGADPLNGDTTSILYCRYQCTNSPAGETFKSFQFPIVQGVNNLDKQVLTFTCWIQSGSGSNTVNLFTRQYFGSGGSPSSEVRSTSTSINISPGWQKVNVQITVPTTGAAVLGACGDDALYLQMDMPLGQTCDVQFTKPSCYLGTIASFADFDTNDQVDMVTQSPRTGDIKTSLRSSTIPGWVAMNDGSIGNASSNSTTRANIDTFPLYKMIWDGVSNTDAPLQNSSGTPISRGVSAVADFAANNRLVLPLTLGRALASAGSGSGLSPRNLGNAIGEEKHTQTLNELVGHTHGPPSGYTGYVATAGGSAQLVVGSGPAFPTAAAATPTASTGGGLPFNVMQPTVFYNVFAKL